MLFRLGFILFHQIYYTVGAEIQLNDRAHSFRAKALGSIPSTAKSKNKDWGYSVAEQHLSGE